MILALVSRCTAGVFGLCGSWQGFLSSELLKLPLTHHSIKTLETCSCHHFGKLGNPRCTEPPNMPWFRYMQGSEFFLSLACILCVFHSGAHVCPLCYLLRCRHASSVLFSQVHVTCHLLLLCVWSLIVLTPQETAVGTLLCWVIMFLGTPSLSFVCENQHSVHGLLWGDELHILADWCYFHYGKPSSQFPQIFFELNGKQLPLTTATIDLFLYIAYTWDPTGGDISSVRKSGCLAFGRLPVLSLSLGMLKVSLARQLTFTITIYLAMATAYMNLRNFVKLLLAKNVLVWRSFIYFFIHWV